MGQESSIRRGLIDAAMMALVTGLSLLLLIYVGFGEATRTFQQFQIEKLAAQGRVVQNTMDTFLRPGTLPIKQFIGFKTLSERILAADHSIVAMTVFDTAGQPIFTSGDATIPLLAAAQDMGSASSVLDLRESGQYLQVVLPLRNRFETVGSLAVSMPRDIVVDRVEKSFHALLVGACLASVAFGVFVAIGGSMLTGPRRRWLHAVYALTFLGMSIAVVVTLVSLYSEGAQAKTKALADSLGQRLNSIVQSGLNITEIRGLDDVFSDYRRLNPDVSAAGLIVDSMIVIHTDAAAVGQRWMADPSTYEYQVNLTRPGGRDIRVSVSLPVNVIYRQIARSVKNFTALFVASAFMAHLFLQLAGSLRQPGRSAEGVPPADHDTSEYHLRLVKPVFFLATFVEHLTYAFLPQYVSRIMQSSGFPDGASAVFMTYYLCFALSLIPAGYFAQRLSPRPLMYGGLVLAAAGFIALASDPSLTILFLARAVSGIGQGMLFIGVQSFILRTSADDRKTRGAAIIVFGFQGGMISGMAIGSLLVTQMGAAGVFWLGALIAAAMALYAWALVPASGQRTADSALEEGSFRLLLRDLMRVLRNWDFVRTMLLVGVPAKAVLTGVIVFAMPLIMAQADYAQEDIGQILMVYAAGVLIANSYASRLVDRTGDSEPVLLLGALLSGVGLLCISATGWQQVAGIFSNSIVLALILLLGVAVVGIAHGFINAPVVTHVARSRLAILLGESSVTATYRFLERVGHIAGPMLMGQLFLLAGTGPNVLGYIGFGVAVCGVLFVLRFPSSKEATS
jgi:predicted MFS family arabinose efflux permease